MVVLLLANGFEEVEALTVVDVLRRRNIDIRTVSVTMEKLVTGTHGIQVMADLTANDVITKDLTMLILPGGMPGVKNLDISPITHIFMDAILKNGGHLAAICAAPSIFGKHGMLTNTKATCFPGFEKDLINAIVSDERVVTDGIFTTAKDFTCSMEFANRLADICESKDMEIEIVELDEAADEAVEELVEELLEEAPSDTFFVRTEDVEAIEENAEEAPTEYSTYKSDYVLAPIDLFDDPTADTDCSEEVEEVKNTLLNVYESFNIKVSLRKVEVGPRFIKCYLTPERGVRVASVVKLLNDVCLSFGMNEIRMEAPIPGTADVGFEIPRRNPKLIRIKEALTSEGYTSAASKTVFPVGYDISGQPVFGDVSKLPHLLVSGATGMGKSVFINNILASLLCKATPAEVKLILIDPKAVEFREYADIPHLLVPVITEAKKAASALMWAVEEMERRYMLLETSLSRNIDAYNLKAAEDPSVGNPLPKIIIVIDELADLMMQVRDPIEDLIMRIAQKARAAGIHLIIGTQRPSVQVITGCIKANIPSRITCKLVSQVDSRTVLEMSGAEKLLNRGDMLYQSVSHTYPIRVQCAYVSDEEISRVAEHAKAFGKDYSESAINEMLELEKKLTVKNKASTNEDSDDTYFSDERFIEAVTVAIESKKISTSFLQRKLSIGYGKAAKYIDTMEELGLISEPRGQKPREVLVTMDEWREMLKRIE